MKPNIAITDFKTILPKSFMLQTEALEFVAKSHKDCEMLATNNADSAALIGKLATRYGVKPTKISKRYFENAMIGTETNSDIGDRAQFFNKRALEIFKEFYPVDTKSPEHIMHVTCTGYVSPSAPQRLVADNKWNATTAITHAYHMGCYASLPTIRLAEGLLNSNNQQVDIVHTEMCALHFHPSDHSPEQFVVQSLFADGHIKYSVVNADSAESGFKLLKIKEQVVADSYQDMSWAPTDWGMKMNLSKEVPDKIKNSIRPFIQNLLTDSPYDLSDVLKNAYFAIHPGGPKIIEGVAQLLELSPEQVAHSHAVLFERGNMSSATLPHIWQKMLVGQDIPKNKPVVSLAFGPGLTIFGALFETI